MDRRDSEIASSAAIAAARSGVETTPAVSSTGQVTLASLLGASAFSAIQLPAPSKSSSEEAASTAVSADVTSSMFAQVLKVITAHQTSLHEHEVTITDMQAQSDSMDKKSRSIARQVERAESDVVDAEKRRDNMQETASRARMEAMPLMERFMEVEVLRHQLETDEEEVVRLRREFDACEEELVKAIPRLSETESLEAELSQAVTEMETAHMDEVTMLRSLHIEEVSDLRVQHATRHADIESSRLAEVSNSKIGISESLGKLRAAIQEAEWESDVYIREQEDSIREVCIKQRDNARLAKRHNEVRQEAIELSMKWESASPPARETELQMVRQRCTLLQRTAAEWGEALQRKSADCSRWRERAAQRGIDVGPGEADLEESFPELDDFLAQTVPATPQSVASGIGANGTRLMTSQMPVALDWSSISASAPESPSMTVRQSGSWSAVPTESPRGGARPSGMWSAVSWGTPQRASASGQSGRSTPQNSRGSKPQMTRNNSAPAGPRIPRLPRDPAHNKSSAFPWDFIESLADMPDESGLIIPEPAAAQPTFTNGKPGSAVQDDVLDGESAHEFLAVALRASQVWAEAEALMKGASHSPDTTAGKPPEVSSGETPEVSSPEADLRSKLSTKLAAGVLEAENELEMLTFMLNDSASMKAEALLEQQARHQPPAVARRLRQHLEALSLRRRGGR